MRDGQQVMLDAREIKSLDEIVLLNQEQEETAERCETLDGTCSRPEKIKT